MPRAPARAARGRAPTRCRSAAPGRGRDRLRATETAGPTRSTSASAKALERGEEEPRVGGQLLDVRVGRHDEHRPPRGRRRGEHRLRRRREPGDPAAGTPIPSRPAAVFSRARSVSELECGHGRIRQRGTSIIVRAPGDDGQAACCRRTRRDPAVAWRPPSRAGLATSLDDRRRRVALLDRHPHDAAAARLDRVAADDLIGRPVGALDEDVGLDRRG